METGRFLGWVIWASVLAACGGTGGGAATPPDASKPEKDAGGPVSRDASRADGARHDAATHDAARQDAGPVYPAPHPPAPQIMNGGTVLTHPKIVTVSFAGDPLESDIDGLVTAIDKTTYWGDRTKEYGIAPLQTSARIHDPTVWPATLDDAQIETWLIGQLEGADAAWPAVDPQAVYTLVFPPGVSITNMAQGLGPSCGTSTMPSWHGYHENVTLPGGMNVAYAIISRCDSIPEDPSATGVDYVSAVMSHEVIEAITDPFVTTNLLGYAGQDDDDVAFTFATGAELGDMCALVGNAFYTPADFPYIVQRIWSNSVAKTGHDPCLPEPAGQVYFNSVPVLTDMITFPSLLGSGTIQTKAVKIPAGQKKTIDVELFSEAKAPGPWKVAAYETDGSSSLSFAFDKTSGQNGDTLHLTITVNSAFAIAPGYNVETFAIISTYGTQLSFWAGLVGN